MSLALPAMALPVRLLPSRRRARGPWTPVAPASPYALPRTIMERLTALLAPFRNRDSALALATMIGRFWSAPARIERAFPLDRRALTDHAALGLTEARVRGAIATLELVGFLTRDLPPAGSRYKATPEGLHRRPILFRFGGEFAPAFAAANVRAQRVRHAAPSDRRCSAPPSSSQLSTSLLEAPTKSPKGKASKGTVVFMGEEEKVLAERRLAHPIEPGSGLNDALARLQAAIFATGCSSGGATRSSQDD